MDEEYYAEVASGQFDKLIANVGVQIKFWYLTLEAFRLQLIETLLEEIQSLWNFSIAEQAIHT